MTALTIPIGSRVARRAVRLAGLCVLLGGAAVAASAAGDDHAGGHTHAHAAGGAAIGQPGVAAEVDRTIAVDMTDDMRFTPAEVTVRRGETVRFALRNSGRLKHELVLGSEQDLKAHDAAMARNPQMEHADPNMLTLAPGGRGEIVWRFTRSGRVDFACLQPGHYAAGMKGRVRVSAGPADAAVLDRPRPGETVRFQAGKVDGRFVVTRIASAAAATSSSSR